MARPFRIVARAEPFARALAVAVLAVSLGAGCGKQGASGPTTTSPGSGADAVPAGRRAPDLSTPASALAAATSALQAGDFEALLACCTSDGIAAVKRDLLAWNEILVDPVAGPRVRNRLPLPESDAEKDLYRAAFRGDPAGLLHVWARVDRADAAPAPGHGIALASPTGPGPTPFVATPAAGVDRVEAERVRGDGTRRRVVLVARDGSWRVDRIQL